ncbi:hypothetical protein NP493_477g03041 [Ridgeia piscesae]|uniref:Uncharacterized protein n=1 Tax=Ridgeia piscesae TaxID=27915 RepID=A0AAD9KZE3_RIDPI|nr:hypothetical protein NP493_477g03041 [Ridgeia piscesae]
MTYLRAILWLCLLGLLAAAIAEDTTQTEQGDDDVESEVEARDTYKDVLSRQKRHSKDRYCGMCHATGKKGVYMQWPCKSYKKICAKWGTCGWWFKKHRCCKKWKWVVAKQWCCNSWDMLYPLRPKYPKLAPVCIKKKYAKCGGFNTTGAKYPYRACTLSYGLILQYFCKYKYKLIGKRCYTKSSFCGGFSKFGMTYPACYYKGLTAPTGTGSQKSRMATFVFELCEKKLPFEK